MGGRRNGGSREKQKGSNAERAGDTRRSQKGTEDNQQEGKRQRGQEETDRKNRGHRGRRMDSPRVRPKRGQRDTEKATGRAESRGAQGEKDTVIPVPGTPVWRHQTRVCRRQEPRHLHSHRRRPLACWVSTCTPHPLKRSQPQALPVERPPGSALSGNREWGPQRERGPTHSLGQLHRSGVRPPAPGPGSLPATVYSSVTATVTCS